MGEASEKIEGGGSEDKTWGRPTGWMILWRKDDFGKGAGEEEGGSLGQCLHHYFVLLDECTTQLSNSFLEFYIFGCAEIRSLCFGQNYPCIDSNALKIICKVINALVDLGSGLEKVATF